MHVSRRSLKGNKDILIMRARLELWSKECRKIRYVRDKLLTIFFRSKLKEIKLLLERKQLDSRWQKHIKW